MSLKLEYPLNDASRVTVAGETPHVCATELSDPKAATSGLLRSSRITCSGRVGKAIRLSAINRFKSLILNADC